MGGMARESGLSNFSVDGVMYWAGLAFLLRKKKKIRAAMRARPARPPTTPPAIGPAFELPLEVGADGVEVEVEVEVESLAVAVPVFVEVSVCEVLDPLVVLDLRPDEVLLAVRDPIVVGVDSTVGVSVRCTDTRLKSRGSWLSAVAATVVASCETEPHPNCEKPPSKWFR